MFCCKYSQNWFSRVSPLSLFDDCEPTITTAVLGNILMTVLGAGLIYTVALTREGNYMWCLLIPAHLSAFVWRHVAALLCQLQSRNHHLGNPSVCRKQRHNKDKGHYYRSYVLFDPIANSFLPALALSPCLLASASPVRDHPTPVLEQTLTPLAPSPAACRADDTGDWQLLLLNLEGGWRRSLAGSAAGQFCMRCITTCHGKKNVPIRRRLLPPVGGAHGVGVGEVGGGVCVVQCATHHDGAGQSVVVVPWWVSVRTHMDFIQDEYCRQTALSSESAGFIRA